MTHPKLTREQWVQIFERLIEQDSTLLSSTKFRGLLSRDENLIANQLTREGTNNVAYRSVDVDITNMTDDEIWELLDNSKYSEIIEENAAGAIMKMAEKLNIF